MFQCEDRGVLSTGNVPWTDEEIAGAISGDSATNLLCIRELLDRGVACRTQSGAIFSKRLVRDEQLRSEVKKRQQDSRKKSVTALSQRSSSSSSTSTSKQKNKEPTAEPSPLFTQCREYAFESWKTAVGRWPTWGPKHYVALANVLRQNKHITFDQFKTTWDNYLASQDADGFLHKQGWSLAFFCSRYDTYMLGPTRKYN
jgi:hypothetical protein